VRAAAERGDIAAIAVRPNVIYGERDRLFTPRLVRAVRARVVPLIGPGTNHLPCVYAGNLAGAIVAALEGGAPRLGFRAYNITADAPPPLEARQFLQAIADACGVRPRFLRLPIPVARLAIGLWSGPSLARAALAFITGENPYPVDRAAAELGWRPAMTAREALARTVQWFHENEKPG
jgi:nucleoside-diphosphate-sugar epimerase